MEATSLLFLKPYFTIAFIGGHSLVDILTALNFLSTSSGYDLYNIKILSFYLAIYFFLMLLIIFFQIVASYSLSMKVTIFSIILWLTPGFLQIFDLVNFTLQGPVSFTAGGGLTPEIHGILINVSIVILFFWSLIILTMHVFKLGKNFKALFDHIWYLFGLSAIIFFIIDYDITTNTERFHATDKQLIEALNILELRTINIENYCKQSVFNKDFPNVCLYTQPLKRYIKNIQWEKKLIKISNFEPNIDTLLESTSIDKKMLKDEINKLNQFCQYKDFSKNCIDIPIEMNKNPKFLSGEISPFDKYFLPTEALLPFISEIWQDYYRFNKKLEQAEQLPYKKWLFFLLVACMIGIKLGITSREIFPVKESSIYRKSLKYVYSLIKTIVNFFISYCIVGIKSLTSKPNS